MMDRQKRLATAVAGRLVRLGRSAALLAIIFCSIIWAGIAWNYFDSVCSDEAGAKRGAEALSALFKENVLRSIREIDRELLYLRRMIESQAGVPDYDAIVAGGGSLSDIIVQVAIIDARGIMRSSSVGAKPTPPTDLSDREHFKVHRESRADELFISKPLIGRASGKWSVQVTRRFSNKDGTFAGVVVASFNPSHFERFYGRVGFNHKPMFELIGGDGVVRATSGPLGPFNSALNDDLSDTRLMRLIRSGSATLLRDVDRTSGAGRLVSLRQVDDLPLWVSVSFLEEDIYADSNRQLLLSAFVGLMLTLLIVGVTRRIVNSERKLKRYANELDLTLEHISQGIIMVAKDGSIPVLNKRCIELLDLPESVLSSRPTFNELLQYLEDSGEFTQIERPAGVTLLEYFGGQHVRERRAVYERTRPNGMVLEVRSSWLENGGFVRTFSDITLRRNAQAHVARLASEDTLTALANRRSFNEALECMVKDLLAEPGHKSCVFSLDLDRFKEVNDTHGHAFGDLLLKAVAARLKQALRSTDMLARLEEECALDGARDCVTARLGGDEFAILITGIPSHAAVEGLAQRLCDTVRRPYDIDGKHIIIDVSIGIAIGPDHGATSEELLVAADLALYAAKAAGRGTFRIFERALGDQMRTRQQIGTDLRHAINDGELQLYFQPYFDLRDGSLAGFEALVRWHHPVKGMIPPADFIPVAEDTGLILLIGAWVLDEACRQAMLWPETLTVAVNLSPVQFANPKLARTVGAALEATGLDPRRLEIEITERILIDDPDSTMDILRSLKESGIRIAMDDFGTGYSSLSYLQSFSFDKIKIDRSFVSRLDDGAKGRAIVRAVIELASSLDMTTTAEGVEAEEQRQLLVDLGCHYAQGYLLGRPIPAGSVCEFIARQTDKRMVATPATEGKKRIAAE